MAPASRRCAVPAAPTALPVAKVAAFSIDDVTTTEIDDAFSVEHLDDGTVRVGIHIAAPGLAIKPDDEIDKIARSRMSTVYMPGDKITMLPDEVVNAFTLAEGTTCPARVAVRRTESGRLVDHLDHDPRRAGADSKQPAPQRPRCAGQRGNIGERRRRVSAQGRTGPAVEMGPEAGSGAHGQARSLWFEAGAGQPRRLQFLCRGRRGLDRAPQARRAAGQDRRRADDFRKQHLGQAAARLRRAGHLPFARRRQRRRLGGQNAGAHGHARGAAPGPRASINMPGARRRCAAIPTWSTSGRSSPAPSTA